MKKCMMVMVVLLYIFIGSAMLFAADTWTPKADVGGIGKEALFGFSNGDKGYTGTGLDDPRVYNDQGKFTPGADPASILYAYFSGYGLYSNNGSTWTWLHATGPTSMVTAGANLYAYFSGYGLYKYNGATWTYLHPTCPTSMAASDVNLYAYFSGYGLYSYNGAAWTFLHPTCPTSMVASGASVVSTLKCRIIFSICSM